jgi:hypothetical protein
MDKLLEHILPTGAWRYPFVIVIVVVWVFPAARKLWLEMRHGRARLDLLKTRLDLAKAILDLRSALKADPALTIPSDLLVFDELRLPEALRTPTTGTREPSLSPWLRLSLGFLGAITPFALRFLSALTSPAHSLASGLGVLLAAVVTGLVGAAWAYAIEDHRPWKVFFAGLTFPLVLSYLVHVNPPEQQIGLP